jgi:hypothetical protein
MNWEQLARRAAIAIGLIFVLSAGLYLAVRLILFDL